jgi:hypothetical protein
LLSRPPFDDPLNDPLNDPLIELSTQLLISPSPPRPLLIASAQRDS